MNWIHTGSEHFRYELQPQATTENDRYNIQIKSKDPNNGIPSIPTLV